jgi:hypothetical protein
VAAADKRMSDDRRTTRFKEIAMRVWVILLSGAMAALSVAMAAAEETRTPMQASLVETSVPKLDCSRPKLPEHLATADDVAGLTKQVNAYAACATRYVNERRAQAQKYGDLAKEEAEASNAAVKEINDFFATARQMAQKGKLAN